jgi:hypothetical protein
MPLSGFYKSAVRLHQYHRLVRGRDRSNVEPQHIGSELILHTRYTA